MDYKQKYEEALERAREYWETDNNNTLDIKAKGTMEYLFPELKESDGERIRKDLITFLDDVWHLGKDANFDKWGKADCSDWIAWLEKQGQVKEYTFKSIPRLLDMIEPSDRAKAYCQKLIDTLAKEGYNTDAKIVEEVLKGWNGEDVPMAVMDEQKPTDKPEPEFKVGDWIVYNDNVYQIHNIGLKKYYECLRTNGTVHTFDFEYIDSKSHLWTIQNAKDGDVLATKDAVFIFKHIDNAGLSLCKSYCEVIGNSKLGFGFDFSMNNVHPATKEQRDTFFAKMEESGYKWNADKKELKKIDNEEVNGEDYGIDGLWHAQRILEKTLGEVDGYQTDDGILSHKCAITAVKKLYKNKPKEWSEEDESMYTRTIGILGKCYMGELPTKVEDELKWLKSFRPQKPMKPSDEQMKALKEACDKRWEPDGLDPLYTLYEDLEKLKGE